MNLEELINYHRRRTPPVDAAELLRFRNLNAAAIAMPDRRRLAELFPTEDPILPAYYREIGEHTATLTPGEEEAILQRIIQGDEEAEKLLAEHYLPLVVAIAWEYRAVWPGLLDRIEEGNRCLQRAVSALSGARKKNIPGYIAEEIHRGVFRCAWERCGIHFREDFLMEDCLDWVLSRVSREDGRIIRELALAEDQEQRLLELAVETGVSPHQIDLVWTRGIRKSREIKFQEAQPEDSCGKKG